MKLDQNLLLHIEDDEDDALLIGRALLSAGIEIPVRVLPNGEEAAQYLLGDPPFGARLEHPLPSLILLDLNTPLMNGHEFLRWLRQQPGLSRIPVIVLTSSSAESDISAAYDAGANAYLVKPLGHAEMVTMLQDTHGFWFKWNNPGPHLP